MAHQFSIAELSSFAEQFLMYIHFLCIGGFNLYYFVPT